MTTELWDQYHELLIREPVDYNEIERLRHLLIEMYQEEFQTPGLLAAIELELAAVSRFDLERAKLTAQNAYHVYGEDPVFLFWEYETDFRLGDWVAVLGADLQSLADSLMDGSYFTEELKAVGYSLVSAVHLGQVDEVERFAKDLNRRLRRLDRHPGRSDLTLFSVKPYAELLATADVALHPVSHLADVLCEAIDLDFWAP